MTQPSELPHDITRSTCACPDASHHQAHIIEAIMKAQLSRTDGAFRNLSCQEKRRRLTILSDVIWDIEAQLAQAKEARAELMISLQSDIRSGSMIR
jgi:hypothetical protein